MKPSILCKTLQRNRLSCLKYCSSSSATEKKGGKTCFPRELLSKGVPFKRSSLHKLQTARFNSPEELQTPSLWDNYKDFGTLGL